ncbi:GNAT family N-acetyltransferase [Lentzea rhizosphaerae]|uniref:GNAT family N-acetyltransferase n=1 Tax=Lentzea rhizosphaerae TaxID=2041025 RepID=A0ABV8C1A1_9PSEU
MKKVLSAQRLALVGRVWIVMADGFVELHCLRPNIRVVVTDPSPARVAVERASYCGHPVTIGWSQDTNRPGDKLHLVGNSVAGGRGGGQADQQEVRRVAEVVVKLSVRDLSQEDLQWCSWSGSALHLTQVARELERAQAGMVDYLAVCPPSDMPVAIGGVDYQVNPGAGTLWQLAVHPALQSCGVGTLLVQAAEQRILDRGLHRAELRVEESNRRARALYERLGYVGYDRKPDAWDAEGPDGVVRRYETVCTVMRKSLA